MKTTENVNWATSGMTKEQLEEYERFDALMNEHEKHYS
jgi:hypothetical protein